MWLTYKMEILILVSKLKINSNVLDLSIPAQLTQDSQQALLVHLGGVALLLLVQLDHLKQLGGVVNNLMMSDSFNNGVNPL